MINRALIRIKVVQMLYSYLLSRSEFKIETAPETSSRDRQFAYNVYVDALLMLLELSGCSISPDGKRSKVALLAADSRLSQTRTAKSLMQDEEVRSLIAHGTHHLDILEPVMPQLLSKILSSTAFRTYSRIKSPDIENEVTMWKSVLNTIVARDPELIEALRTLPEFTVKGFEKGIKMLADTLINYSDTRSLLTDATKDLKRSLDKAYELYHALLWLPVEITRLQESRLENAKEKFLATDDDLNPNTRFIDNMFVAAIRENEAMQDFISANPFSSDADDTLIRTLLDNILQSELYSDYMSLPTTDFASDAEFWRSVLKNIILPSDDLSEALESKSIFWNDDVTIMGSFVLKTMRQFVKQGADTPLLSQYKDEEDAKFGPDLFKHVVAHREEYRTLIDKFVNTERWDTGRLALMDIVILETAIAEILNYEAIPVAVSANEYVEIANWYSTSRSGAFVNGMLAAITTHLREEGRLIKP